MDVSPFPYSSNNVPGGSGADVVMKIFDPRESGVTILGTPGLDDYQGSAFADTHYRRRRT